VRDRGERRRAGHPDRVEREWRKRFHLDAVTRRFLSDQRRRDDLGHVVARLRSQEFRFGEREETVLALDAVEAAGVSGEPARNAPITAVVCGRGQVQRAELCAQSRQKAHRSLRRTHRIAALVHPPVDSEAHSASGSGHELPDSDCGGLRECVGIVPALDEREVRHVLRQPALAQLLPNERAVTRLALQALLELRAHLAREQPDKVLHARMGLVRQHVDVPDGPGTQRGHESGVALRGALRGGLCGGLRGGLCRLLRRGLRERRDRREQQRDHHAATSYQSPPVPGPHGMPVCHLPLASAVAYIREMRALLPALALLAACAPPLAGTQGHPNVVPAPSVDSLHERITTILAGHPGADVAIYYHDLSRPDSLLYHADDSYHAASTMKVPVMIEL